MSQLSMVNVIDFTSTGDTTSQAIGKFIAEFVDVLYPDLNSIRQSYEGISAPTNAEAGMLWLNTSVSPAILNIRSADNSEWIALFPITADAIPAVSGAVQGDIMYYDGTEWALLAPGTYSSTAPINYQVLATKGTGANPLWVSSGIAHITSEVLGTNGYRIWSDGLIEQWGYIIAEGVGGGDANTVNVTFPTPFLSSVDNVVAGGANSANTGGQMLITAYNWGLTGFTLELYNTQQSVGTTGASYTARGR